MDVIGRFLCQRVPTYTEFHQRWEKYDNKIWFCLQFVAKEWRRLTLLFSNRFRLFLPWPRLHLLPFLPQHAHINAYHLTTPMPSYLAEITPTFTHLKSPYLVNPIVCNVLPLLLRLEDLTLFIDMKDLFLDSLIISLTNLISLKSLCLFLPFNYYTQLICPPNVECVTLNYTGSFVDWLTLNDTLKQLRLCCGNLICLPPNFLPAHLETLLFLPALEQNKLSFRSLPSLEFLSHLKSLEIIALPKVLQPTCLASIGVLSQISFLHLRQSQMKAIACLAVLQSYFPNIISFRTDITLKSTDLRAFWGKLPQLQSMSIFDGINIWTEYHRNGDYFIRRPIVPDFCSP